MTQQARPNRVNFVYLSSADYRKVQDDIFALIAAHLPETTTTVEEADPGAINFGIHIRRGRGAQASPMPIDVLMSHGLADKSYMLAQDPNRRSLINNYEHVIVAGSWFKDRLLRRRWHPDPRKRVRLNGQQIHIGGWPRLDPMFAAPPAPASEGRLKLLWAPSHNISATGDSPSSYPAFEKYLPMLEEYFDVRVSLHPSNRTDKTPTQGDLTWADVVISDFGTLLYEAWALGKCVVMPSWLMPAAMTGTLSRRLSAEGHIYARRVGSHARSIEHLIELALLNQPPGQDVQSFMDRILDPAYRGCSSQRVAQLLQSLPIERLQL